MQRASCRHSEAQNFEVFMPTFFKKSVEENEFGSINYTVNH